MTSHHHLCNVVLVRNKSQILPVLKERGLPVTRTGWDSSYRRGPPQWCPPPSVRNAITTNPWPSRRTGGIKTRASLSPSSLSVSWLSPWKSNRKAEGSGDWLMQPSKVSLLRRKARWRWVDISSWKGKEKLFQISGFWLSHISRKTANILKIKW